MHLRVYQVDRLVAFQVILYSLPQVLDLLLDLVQIGVDVLELRTKSWVNDVIILPRLSNVYALLKHLSKLGEVIKSAFELVEDLRPYGVIVVHDVLIKVLAELLESENHVVDLHTVNQLSIIPKFSLNSVEFCIKLLQIRKLKK